LFEEISGGIDPALEKSRRIQAHTNGSTPGTLGALIPEFYKRYLQQRRKDAGDALRTLERELLEAKPSWRDWPISTPTKVDIHAKLDRLMDEGKIYAANRLLQVIRVMFKYAKQRGYIDTNPAEDIDKPGNEKARQRVLDDDELCAVWGAFGELGYPFGPLFKLLLLTGQRKGEVSGMTWDEIDLDTALWSIPAERTKSDRAHKIPLSRGAVDILRSLPRMTSNGYVFSGRESTGHPVSGFAKATERARVAAGVDDWRLHDLRRTVRTRLGEIGTPPHIAELVLNHTVKGLQAVYDRYEYTKEKREALNNWAAHLKSITEGEQGKVVTLK
jgi:integrase